MSTNQACARCRYQRRKCTSECVLAPYFPPDQPKIFRNAHKLFGVGNILRILKELDEAQKMEAMRSIIYEANIRDKFPVNGCLGAIMQYQHQIRQIEEELQLVRSQLAIREQLFAQNNSSQLLLSLPMTLLPQNALDIFVTQHDNQVKLPITCDPQYSCNGNVSYSHVHQMDSNRSSCHNVVNSLGIQTSDDNNNQRAQNQLLAPNIQQDVVDQGYELNDANDNIQSYIDSEGACKSSSESCMRDPRQSLVHIARNELKSAATCFNLTSVN